MSTEASVVCAPHHPMLTAELHFQVNGGERTDIKEMNNASRALRGTEMVMVHNDNPHLNAGQLWH